MMKTAIDLCYLPLKIYNSSPTMRKTSNKILLEGTLKIIDKYSSKLSMLSKTRKV